MAKANRIIIGVDPGTVVLGYGVILAKKQKAELLSMGIVKLDKYDNHLLRLKKIYDRITSLITEYLPDEMAIEAPFFGQNVQSMLKLGRAQGAAMLAALNRDIPVTDYVPMRIKQAVTGNGHASKEQVAGMVQQYFGISSSEMPKYLDATDGLAAALCHYYLTSTPLGMINKGANKNWADYIKNNPDKIHQKKR